MLEERLKHREEAHEKCLEVDAAQERTMKMISDQLDNLVKEQTTVQALRTGVLDAQNTAEVEKDIEARRNNIIFKAPEKKEDMLEASKAPDIEFVTPLFQATFGGKIV